MAAFNPDTDVSYQAYLAKIAPLDGWKRARFDEQIVEYVCWAITNSITIDAAEWTEGLAAALASVNGGVNDFGTS